MNFGPFLADKFHIFRAEHARIQVNVSSLYWPIQYRRRVSTRNIRVAVDCNAIMQDDQKVSVHMTVL